VVLNQGSVRCETSWSWLGYVQHNGKVFPYVSFIVITSKKIMFSLICYSIDLINKIVKSWSVFLVCDIRALNFTVSFTWGSGAQLLRKFSSHLKILGTGKVTWSKFHTEGPQILGATVQNSVVRATWRPRFVLPWPKWPVIWENF
jgi:hypothetical protein